VLLLLRDVDCWCIGDPDRESRRVLTTTNHMRNVIVVQYEARYC